MPFIRGILQRVNAAIQKGFVALQGFAIWLWSRLLQGLAALGRLLIAFFGWIKVIPKRLKLLWGKIKRYVLIFLVFCVAVGVMWLIQIGYSQEWTGFGIASFPDVPNEEIRQPKRLWDWLELLVIPLVLAISAAWFSRVERRNEQNIANQRIEEERKIAEDRAQDAALQSYLEQMSVFLIDKNLRKSEDGSEVRDLARAWTLTFLRRLNGERKGVLLRFLHESELVIKDNYIISLIDADLRGADLSDADLSYADLSGANLNSVDLRYADLRGAKYNVVTNWPDGFDAASHGAIQAE